MEAIINSAVLKIQMAASTVAKRTFMSASVILKT